MDSRLVWLAIGAFAVGTEAFMLSGLLPLVADDLLVNIAQAGYLITVFALTYALFGPVVATLTGDMERRRLLLSVLTVFVAANILAAASPGFYSLMAARILLAVCCALYMAVANSVAVSLVGPERRGRAIAIVMGGVTIATAAGVPIGTLIANYGGWRSTFVVIAAIGVIATIALWRKLPSGLHAPKITMTERITVAIKPGIIGTLTVTMLVMTAGFTLITYIAPFATDVIGITSSGVAWVLLTFGVGAACGNVIGGIATDRFGPVTTIGCAIAGTIVTLLLLALTAQLMVPGLGATVAFHGLVFIWSLAGWATVPALSSRVAGFAPEATAVGLSLNGSALYLGTALGSVAGSLMLSYAPIEVLSLVGASFSACALLALFFFVRLHKEEVGGDSVSPSPRI
ncbi:MAG: MFS transporter [Ectothiorhodospiraceae bacterium]|nr:MFS transporter [Ectothiorhodospiraceae bacterium]